MGEQSSGLCEACAARALFWGIHPPFASQLSQLPPLQEYPANNSILLLLLHPPTSRTSILFYQQSQSEIQAERPVESISNNASPSSDTFFIQLDSTGLDYSPQPTISIQLLSLDLHRLINNNASTKYSVHLFNFKCMFDLLFVFVSRIYPREHYV